MEVMGIFALVGVVFALILGLLIFMIRKRYQSAWLGHIVDKRTETHTDSEDIPHTVYLLIIKTDNGQQIRFDVNQKLYNTWNVGDRLEKKAGQYNPVKI